MNTKKFWYCESLNVSREVTKAAKEEGIPNLRILLSFAGISLKV